MTDNRAKNPAWAGKPDKVLESPQETDSRQVLGKWAGLAHVFDEIGSTMDEARSLAKKGAPHLSLVVANRQTKGRGRLARAWESCEGGLYFTLVTRPALPVSRAHLVLFSASCSLCRVLREKYGVDASVKWPNDLLADGKKISGMLSELAADGERVSHLNLGIGLNVNNDPTKANPQSTSLRLLLGKTFEPLLVLKDFLDEFEKALASIEDGHVMNRWKALSQTLGREVTISTTTETYSGIAQDVDEDGALILILKDGRVQKVIHGDCFHAEKANES